MALNFARLWIRHDRKAPRSQSPVYVLRLDNQPSTSENRDNAEVQFAGWRQRFESRILITSSIVVALLIGVAACLVFGTRSLVKAPSGSRDPLTDFTVPTALRPARRQESHLEGEGATSSSGFAENASANWSTFSRLQDSMGASTLDPCAGANCSSVTSE
ncbi:hypothetical protein HPB50_013873 [Hyalomma asiaticum]|uniref:Uncharacterized protein n=1 Tax=Hyalomma asiaticum TaxID=266040 RepID=A0ACB7SEU6_HYAAI|nr:hypothetical protein HPB50_013873 [Hyalomma asiaticum]